SGGPAVSAGDMSHFVDTDTGTKNATIASDSNNGARVSGTIAIKKATEPESEPESDTTAPTLTVVTTVTSPTRVPSYTFNTDEAGTVAYGGDCSATPGGAVSAGDVMVTFEGLVDGTHSNCTVTVTDAADNASDPLAVSTFETDTISETPTVVTPVSDPTSDSTPDFTFNLSEAGTYASIGSCVFTGGSASAGNVTVTFAELSNGTYSTCQVGFQDALGNPTALLTIPSFTVAVDTTAPVLAEESAVAPVGNDPTPDYAFTSTEAGTISYDGSCSSSTTAADADVNSITFNELEDGTYDDCKVRVTDAAGNESDWLDVSS